MSVIAGSGFIVRDAPMAPFRDELGLLQRRFDALMEAEMRPRLSQELREAILRRGWTLCLRKRMIIREIHGARFALWQGALAVTEHIL